METKPKPCKGINKAKTFKGCGEITLYRTMGLCNDCLGQFLFGNDAGKLLMQKSIIPKAKKITIKNEKEKKEVLRQKITKWDLKLRQQMQKIARLIDYGLPCLARGFPGQMQGGHVIATGGNKTMSYNLHNIHRQCAQSNHFQNDDGLLREGLAKEYGNEYLEFIMNLRRTPSLNYRNEVYQAFYLKARKIALELSKKPLMYSLEHRLYLRNKINNDMGIYDLEYCIFKKEENEVWN